MKHLIMFGLGVYEKTWHTIRVIAALLGQKLAATGDSIDFLMPSFCTYCLKCCFRAEGFWDRCPWPSQKG